MLLISSKFRFFIKSTHTHVRHRQSNKYCYTQYLAMGRHIFLSYLPELFTEVLYINVDIYTAYIIGMTSKSQFFHGNGYISEIFKKCNDTQCLILLKYKKYLCKDEDIDLPETENQHCFLVF